MCVFPFVIHFLKCAFNHFTDNDAINLFYEHLLFIMAIKYVRKEIEYEI